MKKLILVAICFVSIQLSAQGNLQFNQILNLTYTNNFSSSYTKATVGSVIVPAGKVWKIESTSAYRNATTYFDPNVNFLSLFFGTFCVRSELGGNYGISTSYPIWLSEGTYNVVMNITGNSGNMICSVSIIEFNVIP